MEDSVEPPAHPFGSRLLGPADEPTQTLRVRVQVLLTIALVTANVIGAAIVVVLSTLVIPTSRLPPARRALATLRWALDRRPPTDAESTAALRVPLHLTLAQAWLWGIAVLVFTVLVGLVQPALLLTVPGTIAATGVVVCANAYLLGQFVLRPIAARALTGERPDRLLGAGVHVRMLLFWCLGTGVPVAGSIMIALLALLHGGVTLTRLAVTMIVLGGLVLTFGLLVTVLTARAIVAPIHSVRTALGRVHGGDLSVEVPVYDGSELGLLQAGFNRMVRGLREREHIRDLFGRHVGEDVAEAAVRADAGLGGEVREVSVL